MRRQQRGDIGLGHSQVSPVCLLCGNRTRFYAAPEGRTGLHSITELVGRESSIVACGRCRSTSIVHDLAESPGWT
jgi:hypothetical protein